MGAAHWVYVTEILSDIQFGFVSTVHYLNGVEVSVATEYMLNSWLPQGTFLFYGIITLIGFFTVFLFVKETKGLSDTQKKQLYLPVNTTQ